jgi:hypothetical protein
VRRLRGSLPAAVSDTYKKEEAHRIEIAEQALLRRRLQLSGNRFQPKIAWTLQPWEEDALRREVEAGGASPLVVHSVILLPRTVINWAGAPLWAQYAYLLMVEVKAINV